MFRRQFEGMTEHPFSYEDHTQSLHDLLKEIHSNFTDDEKNFLISFKEGIPLWNLLKIEKINELPAVKWKLLNIKKLKESNPEKHSAHLENLRRKLNP